MTEADDGRAKAVQLYKILALLLGLLGTGLLICGLLAVMDKSSNDGGMPYFLGGFIVGILMLTSAAVCTCIFLKAPSANSEIKKKELACAIQGQYTLSMFSILGCFFGCISAGTEGLSSSRFSDEEEKEDDGPKKTLAILIIIGCICAIFLIIFSVCIVCTYGSYLSIDMQGGTRRRIVSIENDGQTTNSTVFQTSNFVTGMQTYNTQIRQLETQNRLLNQQLYLQRQMFEQQQQQQQQHQQTRYSTPVYPLHPPTYVSSGRESPPNYYDVK